MIAVTSRQLTTTESNWLWGLGLAVAGVVVFTAVGAVEEALISAPRRAQLVWSPWETLTRFLAIAHTIVATLFLLSSRRVRSPAGATWIVGLAAAGILLCVGFWALGGLGAALGVTAFFAYFLLHEVRDELYFYRVNGDAPAPRGRHAASLWPWAALLVAGVLVTFAVGILAGARARRVRITGAVLPVHALIAVIMLAVGVAIGIAVIRRLRAGGLGGWRDALSNHRPLIVVLAGLYVVLVGGFALTGRAYAVVAVHVMVWFVFALRRVGSTTAPRPQPFTWQWVRGTRAGFTALHAGVFGAVLAGAGLWAFGFENASEPAIFGLILSRESFPYWTIMHVTLSWVPRVAVAP